MPARLVRNKGVLIGDKELPLLTMREVFPCHPDSASARQYAFNRRTGASGLCQRLPKVWFQEPQWTPETSVWEEDTVPRKRHRNAKYMPPAQENQTTSQVI